MVGFLQRSANIFLGSVLTTIGLTVPAVLTISKLAARQVPYYSASITSTMASLRRMNGSEKGEL